MKRILLILLALLILVSTVACSSNNSSNTENGDNGNLPASQQQDGSTESFEGEWIELPMDIN